MAIQFLNTVQVDTDVLYVDTSSDRVGIGIDNPSAKLHVDGNVIFDTDTGSQPFYITRSGATNQSLKIYTDDVASYFITKQDETTGTYGSMVFSLDNGAPSPMYSFNYGSSVLVRIQANGNVGISDTIGRGKLAIKTSGTFTTDSNDDDFSGVNIVMKTSNTSTNAVGSGMVWLKGGHASRKVAAITNYTYGDTDQSGLNFYVQETAGGSVATLTEAMRITNEGKVGIGLTPATVNLEVKSIQDSSFDEGIGVVRSNTSQTGYINMVGGAMNINAPNAIPIKFRDGGNTNLTIGGDGHATFAGNVDVNGAQITVGNNSSIFAENNLRFKAASDAYIDQNTVGQSFRFRTSSSSSLDTEALVIAASGNATFAGAISTTYVTSGGFTDGYITWNAAQLNRYGAAIEFQYAGSANSLVKIGGGGSKPTIFNANTGDATFAGHVFVEDGNKFFGANAIAASSEDGNYVASFGKSTSGSAKFAGNITVGSGTSTFAGDVTAGNLSTAASRTISILTAAEHNSVLKFRESTNNYGFTQQYHGTGNYFELLRHNNSSGGNTVYRVARDSDNITFYGNILLSGTGRIQGVDTVSAGTDAANKNYVDTTSSAAASWPSVGAGVRTNYTLGFQPTSENYAGFYFTTSAGNGGGYLLIRGDASAGGVYTTGGITLVGDGGDLTIATRTSASNNIRFMTGASSVVRMQITGTGAFALGPSASAYGTSGQVLTSNGNATPGWTTINTGVLSVSDDGGSTINVSGSATARVVTAITGAVSSSSANLATGAQIQTAINDAVTGVLKYEGVWNANTNSPSLSSGSGTVGEYYIVSVAGSTNLDGITDWAVGDWAVFSDQATDAWQKIDNTQVGNVTGSGSNTRLAIWNSSSNITSSSELVYDGTYLKADRFMVNGSNGYFYNDAGSRTAFNGSEFYIMNGVSTFYNYATNQYYGDSSGDNIFFRGSTITGTNWGITPAGAGTFSTLTTGGTLSVSGNTTLSGATNTISGNTLFGGYMRLGGRLVNQYISGLSASGQQAREWEIARAFMDYNDWNSTGIIKVNLMEEYFDEGVGKEYAIRWGYNNTVDIDLINMYGGGDNNNFECVLGTLTQIGTSDIYYLPIIVRVKYYASCGALITTNRNLTTNATSTSGGVIYINSSPTAVNISNFSITNSVEFSGAANNINLGTASTKVGIGFADSTLPTQALDVNANMRLRGRLYDVNNNQGGSGDVLVSTGSGVDWVSASTPGSGTYLPLAGGTMSGNIAMSDNDITGIDQLTFTSGTYLTDVSSNYVQLRYASTAAGGMLVTDSDGTTQGYLYADGGGTSSFGLLDGTGSWAVRCLENQYVELRYDNDVKLRTATGGVTVTGQLAVSNGIEMTAGNFNAGDGERIRLGNSADLQIFHDGSNSYVETTSASAGDFYIKALGTNHDLYLQAADDIFIRPKNGENGIRVLSDDSVELYFNNVRKLRTTSTGINVEGNGVFSGDVSVGDELTITTINNATSDTDKFLVSDSGVVKYRTGAQVLSDIGGAGLKRINGESTVDITSGYSARTGSWNSGSGTSWGPPNITGGYSYNDAPGTITFDVPSGMESCWISQLEWSSGGYVDVHGVLPGGGLVFLRRINTHQNVENSSEGGDHDGSTITFAGTSLSSFGKIKFTNKSGRFHMTGITFSSSQWEGTEGTGMVHPAQITKQGSGGGLDADKLDGFHASGTRNAANTIPIRDANGYLQLGWINTTSGATTSTINKIYVSDDNYIRYITPATFRSQVIDGSYLPVANPTFTGTLSGPQVRIGGTGNGLLSADNSRNLKFKGAAGTDAGFTGYASNGTHVFQVYGSGNAYGFLNGNWASWDLRKVKGGKLYMNNQSTYYAEHNNTSNFNILTANSFVGPLTGNATTATTATTAGSIPHNQNRTDAQTYPIVWMDTTSPSPAYSCAAVTITSSVGRINASKLSIQNQINTNSANLEINYSNGDDTTTNFKNLDIRNGKGGQITTFYGSTKNIANRGNNFLIGGDFGNNSYNSTTGARLLFGGGSVDSLGNYYIGTNLEDFGGNYNKLDLRWHTGIRMGAQGVYGGVRIYDSEDLGTVLFSVGSGNGQTGVSVTNNLTVGGVVDFNGVVNSTGVGALIGRNHAYDTLELRGYGAELMIGSQSAQLHINYRTCNNGASSHTPTDWYWRAGSSSSFSNHYFGTVTATSLDVNGAADISGDLTIGATSTITIGPNTTWNKSLIIGDNANNSTSNAGSIGVTNGNLHLDAAVGSFATYLNYYDGTAGVAFGNGQGTNVAWMGPDGDLWKGSNDNTGQIYWNAGNDGAGSGLDADKLDGQQGSYYLNYANFTGTPSIPSVGNGQIDGRTSGLGLSGSMDATANQSGNTTFTVTSNATTIATGSTIAYRDSSADLNVRLLRANYGDQSTISGAIAFRVNNSSDNYTRYCSSPSAIRAFIGAGTSSTTGTVTSVATGGGLDGGTITTTGTIEVEYAGVSTNIMQSGTNYTSSSIVNGDYIMITHPGETGTYRRVGYTKVGNLPFASSSVVSGVTSVATGSGISGGTITSTGTIQVDGTVIRNTGTQTITGNTSFAPSSTSTSYTHAAIELRESNQSGSSGTPPRISWHHGGVVASSMTIEANGTIAVRNNPGNAYEKFACGDLYAKNGTFVLGTGGTGDMYLGNQATGKYFRFHTNNNQTYFDMNCSTINWREGSSTRYYFYPSTANMTINGTLTQNSDARVKENVVEIDNCISKVQAMKGVYYNRTDFNTDVTKVGVIAQDVEAVLPELILEAPDTKLKSVAYAELTAVLINAIKEQQEIIEDLKTRITQLEK